MLDQGADGAGQDLPVVSFLLLARLMAAQPPGSIDDGVDREGDCLLSQTVPNRRVVVSGNGYVGVLDQALVPPQFCLDGRLYLRGDPPWGEPIIGNRERVGAGLVPLP